VLQYRTCTGWIAPACLARSFDHLGRARRQATSVSNWQPKPRLKSGLFCCARRILWRPTKLITIRFGSAPSSRNRVDDHRVRVRPWAVAIARPAIRSRRGDRGCGCVGRGGSPDIRRTNSSASNGSSSNGSPRCRAAVFAPMHSPANPSNARCGKRPTDPGFSRVQREFRR
jgi:hypothetical protein